MHPIEKYELRPLAENDLRLVLNWRNSERIRINMYSEELISWENHCAWFSRIQNSDTTAYFVIEFKDKPIGIVNFTSIDRVHDKCSWGFYIGDTTAPRGSGTALGILGLVQAFEHLHIRKISAEVFAFNEASLRFHRKLGFVQEGCLSQHILKPNGYQDIVLFAKFFNNWDTEKQRLLNLLY